MALSDLTKTELADKLAETRRKHRETAKRSARIGVAGLLSAAGGVAAAVLSHQMPRIPQTSVPTDAALGVIIIGAAAADMFEGQMNDQLASFAGGLLAVAAAREAHAFLAQRSGKMGQI